MYPWYLLFCQSSSKNSVQPCIQIKLCCYITFSKYQSISCSCCSWSEVYMILAFLLHPICLFAYFRLFTSNSRKLEPFLISLKVSSDRESTLHVYRSYSRLFWQWIIPDCVIQPSPVDDHVQDFPSSVFFYLAVPGIQVTVAKNKMQELCHKR